MSTNFPTSYSPSKPRFNLFKMTAKHMAAVWFQNLAEAGVVIGVLFSFWCANFSDIHIMVSWSIVQTGIPHRSSKSLSVMSCSSISSLLQCRIYQFRWSLLTNSCVTMSSMMPHIRWLVSCPQTKIFTSWPQLLTNMEILLVKSQMTELLFQQVIHLNSERKVH